MVSPFYPKILSLDWEVGFNYSFECYFHAIQSNIFFRKINYFYIAFLLYFLLFGVLISLSFPSET